MSIAIEAVERFFAAINRNDMQAITNDFDPEIVRVEPEGFPTAGTGPKGRASPRGTSRRH
jgi:ketosteroid isomerase-like protein